ncbi:uncharacterized protein LOC107268430 isoform X3 [Cephus cinctus]|uniref:Uncharacterized protein LOC107268430 isoform X3 n=1 Tax=Cephus cinctus TaxID=211228 RepID=A0AAJ7BX93_CEPCN|nr:uncharacterized protein LOC107268430 isoform X3 [Cephus cinctus]
MPVKNNQEEVEACILSSLVAVKGYKRIEELDSLYYDNVGEHIPWRRLGYGSLLDFLLSIPNRVRVESQNNSYVVIPVVSDKVKHVDELVGKQKSETKKYSVRGKSFRPAYNFPGSHSVAAHIPADILRDIVHIVKKVPSGLNKDYILSQIRVKSPYLNVTTDELTRQLALLSHQIVIKGNMVYPAEKRSQSLANSNSEHRPSQSKPACSAIKSQESNKYMPAGSEGGIEDESFCFVPAGYIPDVRRNCNTNYKKPISNFIEESVARSQVSEDSRISNQNVQPQQNNSSGSAANFQMNDIWQHTCTIKNDEIHMQEKSNKSIYQAALGMNSPQERVYNNLLPVEEPKQNEPNYQIVEDNKENDENRYKTDFESLQDLINTRTKFRLEMLIQKFPDGIWCSELPERYRIEYKIPLDYVDLGFSSVSDFAAHLPQIFHIVQPIEGGDFILYNAKIPLPESDTKKRPSQKLNLASYYYLDRDDVDPFPTQISPDISAQLIPADVLTYGECVGQVSVTELGGQKGYEAVLVEEIFTPSFFWIRLLRKSSKLTTLMKDLNEFYYAKAPQYLIPPVVITRGLHCACKYHNEWHRSIVKQVKLDGRVSVEFYDYGTLKTCLPEELHFLHRTFSWLPAQAIPCGLYNVKPRSGSHWTRGVTQLFAERVDSGPLVASLTSIDTENNSMLVVLVDTSKEEDVHINDWMVQQNLAIYGSMGDTVNQFDRFVDRPLATSTRIFQPIDECEEDEALKQTVQSKQASRTENVPLISPQSILHEESSGAPPGFSVPNNNINNTPSTTGPPASAALSMDAFLTLLNNNWTENCWLMNNLTNNNSDADQTLQACMQMFKQNMLLQMQLRTACNSIITDSLMKDVLSAAMNATVTQEQNINRAPKHDNVLNNGRQQLSSNIIPDQLFDTTNANYQASDANANSISSASCNYATNDPIISGTYENFTGADTQCDNNINLIQKSMEELYINNSHTAVEQNETDTIQDNGNSSYSSANGPIKNSNKYSYTTNGNFFKDLCDTNPFKQMLMENMTSKENVKNIIKTNSNIPPPIPKRNPDFISKVFELKQEKFFGDADHINTENINNTKELSGINEDINVPTTTSCTYTLEDETPPTFVSNKNPFSNPDTFVANDTNVHEDDIKLEELNKPVQVSSVLVDTQQSEMETDKCVFTKSKSAPKHTAVTFDYVNQVDEGYLTRPSTSNEWEQSQGVNAFYAPELNSEKESNVPYFTSTAPKAVDATPMPLLPETTWPTQTGNPFSEAFDDNVGTVSTEQNHANLDYFVNIDNEGFETAGDVSYDLPVFYTMKLDDKTVFIFVIDGEGWLSSDQFVELFTQLNNTNVMLKLVDMLNIDIPFKTIYRLDEPLLFYQLDKTMQTLTGSLKNRIKKGLHLTPLKCMIKLLVKIKVIRCEEVRRAVKKQEFNVGSVLYNVMTVINTYGDIQLKHSKNCEK